MCGLSTHSRRVLRRVLTSLPRMGNGPLLLWNETHQVRADHVCMTMVEVCLKLQAQYKELSGFIIQTTVKNEDLGTTVHAGAGVQG